MEIRPNSSTVLLRKHLTHVFSPFRATPFDDYFKWNGSCLSRQFSTDFSGIFGKIYCCVLSGVLVHKGNNYCTPLFTSLCLAVAYCWVYCIGSCVPVHEDRTRFTTLISTSCSLVLWTSLMMSRNINSFSYYSYKTKMVKKSTRIS